MASSEESDSGMASQVDSKDLTPEKAHSSDVADDLDDEDETLSERLWGLTEMFPESLRRATSTTTSLTCSGVSGLYSVVRISAWVLFSTVTILFAPVIFEAERAQMEEMQKQQQRQILLGPSAAMSGGIGGPPPVPRSENGHHHEGFEHIGRGGGGMSLLPQGSSPGLAPQQQVLLRLPAPRHETLAVGKIKCGLWASLALILSFMAAVKFYADHKSSGLAVLVLYIVVCAVLLVLLLVGCVLSLCSTGSSRGCLATRSARASSQNQNTSGPRSALIEVPEEEAATESLMLAQHTQPWIQQQQQQQQQRQSNSPQRQVSQQTPSSTVGEPPPYHIAIWLPQPDPPLHIIPPVQQEVPPPSYDKATS